MPPYYFNLSFSVGDETTAVKENRSAFFNKLNINPDNIVFQNQIHSDIIVYADKAGNVGESDAMITDKKGLILSTTVADCVPIFLYARTAKVAASIHSGWRGSAKKILLKTLQKMKADFNVVPEDIFAYIGPSIDWNRYEVREDSAKFFNDKYKFFHDGKIFLDLKNYTRDIVLSFGVPPKQIQLSALCTHKTKELLHSYRRDGSDSGRSLCLFGMRS